MVVFVAGLSIGGCFGFLMAALIMSGEEDEKKHD